MRIMLITKKAEIVMACSLDVEGIPQKRVNGLFFKIGGTTTSRRTELSNLVIVLERSTDKLFKYRKRLSRAPKSTINPQNPIVAYL